MTMQETISSNIVKAEATSLGFSACGIARAKKIDAEVVQKFKQWIADGKNAGMNYMNNYEDIRFNPTLLLDGCKSIISVALNYYPQIPLDDSQYQFAYYAYGKDYHNVIRKKLHQLTTRLNQHYSSFNTQPNIRVCVDTAPILERYWAGQSGLGWIGKNGNLIIPDKGSFFFLGEILIDKEVDKYDSPLPSRCGNCTKCIEACPGKAICANGTLNANRCLSYITIEHHGQFSEDEKILMRLQKSSNRSTHYYIYGCDRCQLICPYNKFASPNDIEEFSPSMPFKQMTIQDWELLNREKYQQLFNDSAVKRAKYEGLKRNIDALFNNK